MDCLPTMWHLLGRLACGFTSRIEHSQGCQDILAVGRWELSGGCWVGVSPRGCLGFPIARQLKFQEGRTLLPGFLMSVLRGLIMALPKYLWLNSHRPSSIQEGGNIHSIFLFIYVFFIDLIFIVLFPSHLVPLLLPPLRQSPCCCPRPWEKGREAEREGRVGGRGWDVMWERNINWLPLVCTRTGAEPATQAHALTRNWTSDPLVCRMKPNQLCYTSQGIRSIFWWEEQPLLMGRGGIIWGHL